MLQKEIDNYIASATLLTEQITKKELAVILRELSRVIDANVPGDIVEFGCYEGTTSVHLQHFLQGTTRKLWVYDSFEGLPEKRDEDKSALGEQFVAGELHAKKQTLVNNFRQAHLPLPIIRKGWFSGLTEDDIPKEIAFAFLDGDYYDSIVDPLKLIWTRIAPGGVVVVDDYTNDALPGARRAVDDWVNEHGLLVRSEASLAVLRP